MSLINHPGSHHQIAVIELDAGHARDIMLMLTGAHALAAGLASGHPPAAARQAATVLRDADPRTRTRPRKAPRMTSVRCRPAANQGQWRDDS